MDIILGAGLEESADGNRFKKDFWPRSLPLLLRNGRAGWSSYMRRVGKVRAKWTWRHLSRLIEFSPNKLGILSSTETPCVETFYFARGGIDLTIGNRACLVKFSKAFAVA